MSVQLHITMDDTLYARLKKEIRPKRISAFISEAVRAKLGPARRGDVYWVALDPSNDSCNAHGRRVVVLPITSNVDSLYPGEGADPDQGSAGTRDPRSDPLAGQSPLAVQNRIADSAGDGRRG